MASFNLGLEGRRSCQTPLMPNKDRPLVDCHAPKNGVGWLLNDQKQEICSFTSANQTAHAQWVIVENRSLRGSGQPVIRRMLRSNAIEAWETMQKAGGWKSLSAEVVISLYLSM